MTSRKRPEDLRSHRWLGVSDLRSFGHRSRLVQMGYSLDEIKGKPVIAIINTWSDINPCHAHFKTRAEEVKRGIWQAGGFPIELPAMTLDESYTKPTSMLYRNFLAMETEELLRSHPVDGAVLMGGCDKTTPATMMGAISMNIPTLFMPAGPMLRGNWGGKILGSGSDVWKYWAERKAGNITEAQWLEMEQGIARSYGTCMTMGTASTMTGLAETLGLSLPGASSIPAADAGHGRMAAQTGGRYFFGADQNSLEAIYATLDRITPHNHKTLSWRPRRELFMWPLGAAIGYLAGAGYLLVVIAALALPDTTGRELTAGDEPLAVRA